jgi:hypothetical protein
MSTWDGVREPLVKSVGKPDARNGHVRFDERGRETGRHALRFRYRALPRLYPTASQLLISEYRRKILKASGAVKLELLIAEQLALITMPHGRRSLMRQNA